MHSPGISVNPFVIGLAVIAFIVIVALAQGIGQSAGNGICEALFPGCQAVGQ